MIIGTRLVRLVADAKSCGEAVDAVAAFLADTRVARAAEPAVSGRSDGEGTSP